jgi:hypothetical protein
MGRLKPAHERAYRTIEREIMKISEQKRFVRELTKTVITDVLNNVHDMPSDWDGIELRQYLADRFAREVFPMKGARLRNYRNTLSTTTL